MHYGSCLCGTVKYQLLSNPKAITHCHCSMCQKQYGAAFATYGSVPVKDLLYLSGQDALTDYRSSPSIIRRFCRCCGSNIEWRGSGAFPDWVSIAMGTLDSEFVLSKPIKEIHIENRVCWLSAAVAVEQ